MGNENSQKRSSANGNAKRLCPVTLRQNAKHNTFLALARVGAHLPPGASLPVERRMA